MERNGAPPSDKTDEELVLLLESRDPASAVVDFTLNREIADQFSGKSITKFRIQILTSAQKIQAKQRASVICRDTFKAQWRRDPTADDTNAVDYHLQFEDYLAIEMLYDACRRVDKSNSEGRAIYGRLFRSPQWMRDNLTAQEMAILFRQMMFVEVEQGSIEQVLDDDPATLRLWLDRVKAGLWKLDPLARLASADSGELILSWCRLADKLESFGFPILDPQFLSLLNGLYANHEKSPEDKSSSGEQPESSSLTPINEAQALELAQSLRSPS
jgi:hypothetical protein